MIRIFIFGPCTGWSRNVQFPLKVTGNRNFGVRFEFSDQFWFTFMRRHRNFVEKSFFFCSGGRAWRPANAAKFGADFCQIWFPKQREAFRSNFPWFSFNKRKCGAKHSPQTGQMVKCLDTRSRLKIWCYSIDFWSLLCHISNSSQDPS